jgi:hypothetical protein
LPLLQTAPALRKPTTHVALVVPFGFVAVSSLFRRSGPWLFSPVVVFVPGVGFSVRGTPTSGVQARFS